MGISSEMRDSWAKRRESLLIASAFEEDRIRKSRECTQGISTYVARMLQKMLLVDPPKVVHFGGSDTEGVREGTKAAAVACVASAIPTLVAVRTIPWAKANLNYTAQALIISAASIAAYFITADKTILECARRNTHYDKSA